jgi:ectoine hydroxylase-related dioxygenase (phytanoyl-CoA dioxygenase family)
MLTAKNRQDLEEKGYTVVEEVLTDAEADEYRKEFHDWVQDNFDQGSFPDSWNSLIHK